MDMLCWITFKNRTIHKEKKIYTKTSAVADIVEWYVAFYAGDKVLVEVDGEYYGRYS